MSKLFMVYLGGSAPKANIELHDIQFVTGDKIEDTYDQLKNNWFGDITGLHLDSYKEIKGADGYNVTLQDEPQLSDKHLYFVNFGGYQKDKLCELHEFALFVAGSASEAKNKAKHHLLKNSLHQHPDDLMEIDHYLKLVSVNKKYVHLQKSGDVFDLQPDWFGYNVIG